MCDYYPLLPPDELPPDDLPPPLDERPLDPELERPDDGLIVGDDDLPDDGLIVGDDERPDLELLGEYVEERRLELGVAVELLLELGEIVPFELRLLLPV